MSKKYEITFVTPFKHDNGTFKPTFRKPYPSLPIRITVPKFSTYTLPSKSRVVISRFSAKIQYGAGCTGDDIFHSIGLSTVVDNEGFREIRNSHLNTWIVFKDPNVKLRRSSVASGSGSGKIIGSGIQMKSWTPKTGIVEVKNIVFQVPGLYRIAFELEFDDGQKVGRTPWQTVEVLSFKRNDSQSTSPTR